MRLYLIFLSQACFVKSMMFLFTQSVFFNVKVNVCATYLEGEDLSTLFGLISILRDIFSVPAFTSQQVQI